MLEQDHATPLPISRPVAAPVSLKAFSKDERALSFRFLSKNKKTYTSSFNISLHSIDGDTAPLGHAIGLKSLHSVNPTATVTTCYSAQLAYTGRVGQQNLFEIKVNLLWKKSGMILDNLPRHTSQILDRYFPRQDPSFRFISSWSPRDFYDNVHVPEKTDSSSAKIRHPLISFDLYPFQRRAVRWLLNREGVKWINDQIQPSDQWPPEATAAKKFFIETKDANGHQLFVSHALGIVTDDLQNVQLQHSTTRGGILAEEMGLGKTVEMIALICLHRQSRSDFEIHDAATRLRRTGSTLIITPPSILEQWKEELQTHSPGLEVFHYQGLKHSALSDEHLIGALASSDVVLTTYNVLSNEIHYADEKPQRNFRNRKRFEPRRSPLVQLLWWRVCLDEAQMVESGVSNAAKVARLIPRCMAWAVSGTPLRQDHKDLFGLLLFLHCEPWSRSLKLWTRLLSSHTSAFKSMINSIAIRHNKDAVRDDLQLPPQTRNVITIPFTPIEEQHYLEQYRQMCEACGLDECGGPLAEDWDPNLPSTLEQMRTWLTRLRQTCLHPEVGRRNRRALGTSGGPLRTVMDVLEVMIDQNDGLMRSEQRTVLLSQLRRGQLYENAKQSFDALKLWEDAYERSSTIVDECRDHLKVLTARHEATSESKADSSSGSPDETKEDPANLQAARVRLRTALETQHIAIFFIGNACYQIKTNEELAKPDSPEFEKWEKREEDSYEKAKAIRAEILVEILGKANRNMEMIKNKFANQKFASIPQMQSPDLNEGIENRRILEKMDEFCETMNAQAEPFAQYKQKMIDFLSHSLVDEDEGVELKGDEYEASTKHQDEMYVYMEVLRAFFADRHEAITGQENLLITNEMKAALRMAKDGAGPAPELFIKVLADRQRLKPDTKRLGSLRSIIVELRAVMNSLEWREGLGNARAKNELVILDQIMQAATTMSKNQTKIIDALEKDLELFRDTMNLRLEYYRQLQRISDTVAPWNEESVGQSLDQALFDAKVREESSVNQKVSKLEAKRRYLIHLRKESTSQESRICIICQSDFETGTLTVCGHQFCKDCIKLWYHDHRTCPVCKRRLHASDLHDISYKPQEMTAVTEEKPSTASTQLSSSSSNHSSPKSSRDRPTVSIYSSISPSTLSQIKSIDLTGPHFGTKVSMLCRHLIWLRHSDPGSKTIIFSQYREFLSILSRALTHQKISHSSVEHANGLSEFKSNPATECFLLHAKAHAAGMNLTAANHVFLCEPLVNTAIELQAIARVHRIGQRRKTSVWMYLVSDTVEEAIYDISVTRRLEHVRRSEKNNVKAQKSKQVSRSDTGIGTPVEGLHEKTLDEANSQELRDAILAKMVTSGRGGGELVKDSDLWGCLFGKGGLKRDKPLEKALGEADGEGGRWLREEAAMKRAN